MKHKPMQYNIARIKTANRYDQFFNTRQILNLKTCQRSSKLAFALLSSIILNLSLNLFRSKFEFNVNFHL